MTRNAPLLIAPLLLCAALGGCASERGPALADPTAAILPTEQYAIEVRQQPAEIRLALHRDGLSPAQQSALADAATRWRSQGSGVVTIQAPAAADRAAVIATSESARSALVSFGVPAGAVQVVSYSNTPDAPPVVVVGFAAYVANGPQCGRWEDIASNTANMTGVNFGCSVTANIATQIANPGDLISPRQMTASDASRRSIMLDHYRKGEVSSSAKDDQANGTLATAGGNNQ